MKDVGSIIEALIFASPTPLSLKRLERITELSKKELERQIEGLNETYQANGRSFRIRYVADGYQFYAMPKYSEYISQLINYRPYSRLSRAALEVLSIVAINQPVTLPVIETIRDVSSRSSLNLLIENGLVTIKGRDKSPGKPFLYGTTQRFLKMFGLESVDEIPDKKELEALLSDGNDEEEK